MIKLGTTATDSITGASGVAIARCEYLYGCVQVQIQPKETKDGKPIDTLWFDEQRLSNDSTAKLGGPQEEPLGSAHPPR